MTKVILTPTSPSIEKIEIMAQNMIRVYYRSGRIEPFNVSKAMKEIIENLQLKGDQSWKIIHGFGFKENLQTERMSDITNLKLEIKELNAENKSLQSDITGLHTFLDDLELTKKNYKIAHEELLKENKRLKKELKEQKRKYCYDMGLDPKEESKA